LGLAQPLTCAKVGYCFGMPLSEYSKTLRAAIRKYNFVHATEKYLKRVSFNDYLA
jgi:hypothetical protein